MISDKKPVQDFVQLLQQYAIEHVIITPGSRNAPFIISLSDHPTIQSHSVVDERSAAFVALGMAQQLRKPVVLICTSGTAALNFAPAIAEAYYQRIPLLVVTADRPIEWIDQGEGQSIRQRNVFQNFVKASYEIAEEASEGDLVWYNVRIMDEAMRLCTEGVPGPVHINFPLRESLYRTAEPDGIVKTIQRAEVQLSLSPDELRGIHKRIATAQKVMILAGQLPPIEGLREHVIALAERENVVVFTEAHSNLSHPQFISTIDRLIMGLEGEEIDRLVPDLLITIGHNIISRKIKEYLRKGQPEHWHVDVSGEGLDTYKHLTKIIPLHPVDFFRAIDTSYTTTSNYRAQISAMNDKARNAATTYLKEAAWSDLKAFDIIMKHIPAGQDLQMGNSSVVRYILLSDSRSDLRYYGNRGVAGIDGCTSTAVGAAYITQKPTTLISGDIAFFYDSNAFWNNLVSSRLKVIVINNSGGGIFRIIPGPSTTGDALDTYFETVHQRSVNGLAAMYHLPCHTVRNEVELEAGLQWLYEQKSCAILEIVTPREKNDTIQKRYFQFIKENK
ncbi:MAG TPA: 2-succinyl-5-enolpyruvyl-6-hydroxy-3-cyclohexene-1-carboxylic-acid synthase [Flavobacteriales bacterium]